MVLTLPRGMILIQQQGIKQTLQQAIKQMEIRVIQPVIWTLLQFNSSLTIISNMKC